jgi:F-type H+-transporting ATPase subunit gamma
MSKRREVERRIVALDEIRSIMTSVRNLALMELHKLARYHDTQERVVQSMQQALDDVRQHYLVELAAPAAPAYVLFGSERGFCGAYNERLLEVLARQPDHDRSLVIGIGRRLAGPLRLRYPQALTLAGAAVADETDTVLVSLLASLNRLRAQSGALRLQVIYFRPDHQGVQCHPVVPPRPAPSACGIPPIIQLAPPTLLGELLEHYLFAVAHAWLFSALTAENQLRIQHLEQATRHLERQVDALATRRNSLRQEEIIEEIEVLLLNGPTVGEPGAHGDGPLG